MERFTGILLLEGYILYMSLTLPICLACKILARRLRNRCDMYILQRLGGYGAVLLAYST